ncbi:RHD3/Sey1 [Melampsora americana]|nr:RHD3/Sey1 [Melampsora americana]
MAHNGIQDHMTERLQVIGEEQRFTTDLSSSIEKWGLLEKGFNYDLVAVFGSQSSGKSTLLNRVFGTTFEVMDETDRRQTTKGIWMCKGKEMDVLVMDVEGADGRERGENQDFERKAALFSLAASEVIIVNLWEHQVGLYQGANMGLLKTVFEVDLALFQANKAKQKLNSPSNAGHDKTNLFFVIRDHIGVTPLSNLEKTITGDLNRIWDGLAKPEGTENSRITDYFDLTFTTLAHKILQPDNFDKGVEDLRRRFIDKSHPDYIFKPIYHKRIPADGLAQYMSGIWDAVVSNKDLDLPTQQELLAQFRCDEIAVISFNQFSDLLTPIKSEMEFGSVLTDLGSKMDHARSKSLASFDLAASRYHAGVYQRKRTELLGKMNTALGPIFWAQLKNLTKTIIKKFKSDLLNSLKRDHTTTRQDFGEVVKEHKDKATKEFESAAASLVLKDTDWTYSDATSQLQEDLTTISNQCKVDEMKKVTNLIEKSLKREMSELVESNLATQTPKMWDMVLDSFQTAVQLSTQSYLKKTQGFSCTDEENEKTISLMTKKAWIALRNKVDEQTADTTLLIKLKLAFEERFRYDADGVPKVWKPEDDIDTAFRGAKDETLALIPLYGQIRPSDPCLLDFIPTSVSSDDLDDLDIADYDFESSASILSVTKQNELRDRFKKECDAYYLEAKRSLVSSISQIPYWMYAVIGVLGWNEFLAVVSSPIYFATLLTLAVTAYMVFKMDMQGPVMAIGKGIYNETSRVTREKLTEYLNDPSVSQRPQMNSTSSSRSNDFRNSKREVKEEIELQSL